MYDVSKLKTPDDCRTVMQRARDRDLSDVYNAAFKRFCELIGNANDEPSDPLVLTFTRPLLPTSSCLQKRMDAPLPPLELDKRLIIRESIKA